MKFFKKKTTEQPSASLHKSLQEIAHERVLTAEGWRRKFLKKAKKAKSS